MAYIHEMNKIVSIVPDGSTTYVPLSQNENGRKLIFEIDRVELPSGSTATLSGTKPDGVVYSSTGEVDDNLITFEEDLQMTAVDGTWDAKIRVFNEGRTVATARIRFIIDKDPVDYGSVPSDSQLDGLVAEVQMYAENVKNEAYGSPLVARVAADMINTDKVYVYVGNEDGYTNGNWYYYDGYTEERVVKTQSVNISPNDLTKTIDISDVLETYLASSIQVSVVGDYEFTYSISGTTLTIVFEEPDPIIEEVTNPETGITMNVVTQWSGASPIVTLYTNFHNNGAWISGGVYNSVAVTHAIIDLSDGTLIIS